MEAVLEGLILSSTGLNIPVEEMRLVVGSYRKGTMLAGHPVADLVIILKQTPGGLNFKNFPSLEIAPKMEFYLDRKILLERLEACPTFLAADIENLANKVQEKLKEATPSEGFNIFFLMVLKCKTFNSVFGVHF